MAELPSHSRIVIVGGGIVGASVAYHLALRGETDVLLLERNKFTSGTTWHAAGLVGQLRATRNLTQLAQYTSELFGGLEAATGQATGFMQRGSLGVARTPARFEELKRQAAMAAVQRWCAATVYTLPIRFAATELLASSRVSGVEPILVEQPETHLRAVLSFRLAAP